MATIKLRFRASSDKSKEGTLFYKIIHNRLTGQISSGYKIFPAEWNRTNSEITPIPGCDETRCVYLSSVKNAIEKDMEKIRSAIIPASSLANDNAHDMITKLFHEKTDQTGFIYFAENIITQMSQAGKDRTAESYATSINSFSRFCNDMDVALEEITSSLMTKYETYLRSTGICQNSSSYYMRNLRAIYNRAVEKHLTQQRYPFKHVYTGIDKTVKRALPLKTIRKIKNLRLDHDTTLDYARDIFMFSFYTRGMSFVDMAFLRKDDLRNGILSYRRKKTDQQLFIKWEEPMNDIIKKYDTSRTPYLLPIIRDTTKDERKQYKNAVHLINAKLKKLGKTLNLPIPLTTYVARHAWASIAKSKNISLSVISEAMGHESETTTRIYLASFDTSSTDKANKIILKSL